MIDKKASKIFDDWLKVLSSNLKVKIELDDDRICSLKIGKEHIVIELSRDYETAFVSSFILPLPDEDPDLKISLMIKALEMNTFQTLTFGGALGVAPGYAYLVFIRSVKLKDVSVEQLNDIFNFTLQVGPSIREEMLEL